MKDEFTRALTRAITRGIFLAAGLVAVWTFFDAITSILLFFVLAIVFAIAMIPPVNWLERRGVPRPLGTILTLLVVVGAFVGLGYLVAPQIAGDLDNIVRDLPKYGKQLNERKEQMIGRFPALEQRLQDSNLLTDLVSPSAMVRGIGKYSMSLVAFVVGALVFLSVVMYTVANPRPLIRGLLQAVPLKHRDKFAVAFARGSNSVVNWLWANAILGAIEAVVATGFLLWLGVPGAWVWGLVTFFAELVPFVGSYLMAVPPAIVAFSVEPMKAVWVIGFYIVLQQLASNLLAPMIRARTMRIHPVSELFAVLGLSIAFGIIGAVLASPLIGFAKAIYDEFYGERNANDPELDATVEKVLARNENLGERPSRS